MANLTQQSKDYIKSLDKALKTEPKDILKLLNELKEQLNAHRIDSKRSKARNKSI